MVWLLLWQLLAQAATDHAAPGGIVDSIWQWAFQNGPFAVLLVAVLLAIAWGVRAVWNYFKLPAKTFLEANTEALKTVTEEVPRLRESSERTAVALQGMSMRMPSDGIRTLLVIEDSADDLALIREYLDKLLTESRTQLAWAQTLGQAMPYWRDADAVLADAHLPDCGSYTEVIKYLNRNGRKPMALYTGMPTPQMLNDAEKVGLKVISKNADPAELIRTVEAMLEARDKGKNGSV